MFVFEDEQCDHLANCSSELRRACRNLLSVDGDRYLRNLKFNMGYQMLHFICNTFPSHFAAHNPQAAVHRVAAVNYACYERLAGAV